MAQFVTHIQPTLMEASHHHAPRHHKDTHRDQKGKETISHLKMHHEELESHLKDAQRHQGHPREYPVLPKEHHHLSLHHDDFSKLHHKSEQLKAHQSVQFRDSRTCSEDAGHYIDSHGIPHSYQMHFIDAQGIYRDSEGHALDGHSKTKSHEEKLYREKESSRKGSTELDEKMLRMNEKENSRPAPPQYIDILPITLENKLEEMSSDQN